MKTVNSYHRAVDDVGGDCTNEKFNPKEKLSFAGKILLFPWYVSWRVNEWTQEVAVEE